MVLTFSTAFGASPNSALRDELHRQGLSLTGAIGARGKSDRLDLNLELEILRWSRKLSPNQCFVCLWRLVSWDVPTVLCYF